MVPAFIPPEVQPLISAERIAVRVNELAAQISRDYAGRSVVLLSVLKGSFMFAADLARAIDLPIRMEFLGGKLLYAMRVVSHGAFNLCPSEACNLLEFGEYIVFKMGDVILDM